MNGGIHLSHSFKKLAKVIILVSIAVFIFEMLFPLLSSSAKIKVEMLRDMEKPPEEAVKIFGNELFEAVVEYGFIIFGYIHPFILMLFIIYISYAISQMVTSEIASGSIGFLLSRPISRQRIFFNLAIVTVAGLLIISMASFLGTCFGIYIFLGHGNTTPFISIVINLFIIMLFISGYLALFAATADTGKSLFIPSSIALFIFYVADLISPLWEPLKYLSPINPFFYYRPIELLAGKRLNLGAAFAIPVLTGLLYYLASRIFRRRDFPSG